MKQRARVPYLPGPGVSRRQNSGSLPAAAPCGPRRGGGRAHRLERGPDGSRDDCAVSASMADVAAEQHAADHPPGAPGRVLRADGSRGGTGSIRLCHTREAPVVSSETND